MSGAGWGYAPGSGGSASPTPATGTASDATYRHVQNAPAKVWTVSHNLGKKPSITVVDSAGNEIEGDNAWPDLNTVTVTFAAPFSGEAFLN